MLTTVTVEPRTTSAAGVHQIAAGVHPIGVHQILIERIAEAPQSLPAPAVRTVAQDDPARGMSVWKVSFVPGLDEEIAVTLPHPALPLGVDWEADGRAVLWMQVAPGRHLKERRLLVVQTSREGLPPSRYVGTLRNPAGCAFHVFEVC